MLQVIFSKSADSIHEVELGRMDTAVAIVRTYLELSGYFVLSELPVRAADKRGYHDVTDLDIIAVRFPHPTSRQARRTLDLLLGCDPQLQPFDDGVDVLIGDVKEGEARLNPALHRTRTIEFALRRVGCCPEDEVHAVAWSVSENGSTIVRMPAAQPCRVRLVAFGGHGLAPEHGVLTISIAHCIWTIERRLREGRDVLSGAHFKDPVLGVIALMTKLDEFESDGNLERLDGRLRIY